MQALAQIVFWSSVLALAHTYFFYPLMMRLLARGKAGNTEMFLPDDADLPLVSVLMSVHNEEQVIAEKLASLRQLRYPAGKLRIFIGSDNSADRTNDIIQAALEHQPMPALKFFPFAERRGKPPVINELSQLALMEGPADQIFLLTDASVMLEPDTLYRLVRHFKNSRIGVVDAHMRSRGLRTTGISRSEERYLSGEMHIKHWESLAWGMMIGPFGGCYAMRARLFEPIPPRSLVDDFWLVFRVLEKGYMAINDLDAVCYEGATHRIADEYRRKKRIAAGSFQNLARFRRWVMPPATRLGFAFFSHKVLRWFGGFFLVLIGLSAGYLGLENQIFSGLFWLMAIGAVAVVILNDIQERFRIGPFALVKNVTYFLAMNVALMDGFFKWLRGIRENTWPRTARSE